MTPRWVRIYCQEIKPKRKPVKYHKSNRKSQKHIVVGNELIDCIPSIPLK